MRGLFSGLLVLLFQAAPAPRPVLDQVLATAGQEVRRFEREFTLVVSDEDYWQHAEGHAYNRPQHQRTQSDMLFLWLPDEGVWLTVRNVLKVNGRDVAQSKNRLRSALGEPD